MRVGIIGLGVGEQHIRGYRQAGCEIAALCDLDEERMRQVARIPACASAKLTTKAEEILTDPDIDIVSVASYDHFHAEQVLAALRAGKHVFCEKPLCRNREEAAEIHAALGLGRLYHKSKLSCNLPLRYSPRFQQARELDLGRIYYIDAAYDYGRAWKLEGWRGERDDYSVVCGGLVHMVDLVMWITGERPKVLSAHGSKTLGYPFNDLVVATLEMEGGALVKLTANFPCHGRHRHVLKLYGTEGTYDDGVLSRGYDDDPQWEVIDGPLAPKYAAIPDFVEAIRNDTEPPISPKEVFEAMEVCLAIEEAVDSVR